MNTLLADASEHPNSTDPPPCGVAFGVPHAIRWTRIPLQQAARQAAPKPSPPGTWVNHEGEGHQVLVVDDNRDAADSLAQLFGVMGAKVSVAYGAQEALVAMTTDRPRIAVIDISMPLMNGYELAAQIRACDRFEGVILIALTGWSRATDTGTTASTGFDHHLTKPANVHQLARLLESVE